MACAKYRQVCDENKCEFVAHRRHNASRAFAIADELKRIQGRADEISATPLWLMSHPLLEDLAHVPAHRVHLPAVTVNNARGARLQKKEAGFPAPLAMTTKVYFVFFLATAITFARSAARRFVLQSWYS
jgi:hypothetical protein